MEGWRFDDFRKALTGCKLQFVACGEAESQVEFDSAEGSFDGDGWYGAIPSVPNLE